MLAPELEPHAWISLDRNRGADNNAPGIDDERDVPGLSWVQADRRLLEAHRRSEDRVPVVLLSLI
jgi:hypothetical protein